ncbi:MAG: 2-amino-4-hydroxy-6-hydroxymethyldihydropteridine diphosphokinase [Chitinophagaceae bacterium]|nr:2-amino-4-hydroxy-6-hydroxymethyldihydropteridine diphosphokinase [Chitinophagaceae bacterium]
MNKAYLLTGGNTGERQDYLAKARQRIEHECGKITKISGIYETAAWGKEDQASFLNQALLIETDLSAADLMTTILAIELNLGRKRQLKYGPRTIDIDVLLFNSTIIHSPLITVPHPELRNRRFALEPLNEIAPDYVYPGSHLTVSDLLAQCPDPLPVVRR